MSSFLPIAKASVGSESSRSVVLTSQAGHAASPLDISPEKPNNEVVGFRCGLRPRLILALPSAQTDGRVLLFYFLLLVLT